MGSETSEEEVICTPHLSQGWRLGGGEKQGLSRLLTPLQSSAAMGWTGCIPQGLPCSGKDGRHAGAITLRNSVQKSSRAVATFPKVNGASEEIGLASSVS